MCDDNVFGNIAAVYYTVLRLRCSGTERRAAYSTRFRYRDLRGQPSATKAQIRLIASELSTHDPSFLGCISSISESEPRFSSQPHRLRVAHWQHLIATTGETRQTQDMGGSVSRILSLLWSKKEIRILILGLVRRSLFDMNT